MYCIITRETLHTKGVVDTERDGKDASQVQEFTVNQSQNEKSAVLRYASGGIWLPSSVCDSEKCSSACFPSAVSSSSDFLASSI